MLGSSLAALLASAACLFPPDDGPSEPAPPVVSLATLAGHYYFGDGLGSNHTLEITPDGQFEYELSGCLGLYDCNSGHAEVIDGHLVLKPRKIDPGRIALFFSQLGELLFHDHGERRRDLAQDFRDLVAEFQIPGTPTDFIPVRWGDWRYLVPASDGPRFCNYVNLGHLSRFPLRSFYADGDSAKKPGGLPCVPEDWASMLLAEPITGQVVEVLPDNRARVDLGGNDGAWVGMSLWIDSRHGSAEVVSVDSKTCVIQVSRDDLWARMGREVRSWTPDDGRR